MAAIQQSGGCAHVRPQPLDKVADQGEQVPPGGGWQTHDQVDRVDADRALFAGRQQVLRVEGVEQGHGLLLTRWSRSTWVGHAEPAERPRSGLFGSRTSDGVAESGQTLWLSAVDDTGRLRS